MSKNNERVMPISIPMKTGYFPFIRALTNFNNAYRIFLIMIGEMDEDNKVIISQTTLADYSSLNRETVSKYIDFLINNRIIKKGDEPFSYFINSRLLGRPEVSYFSDPIPRYIKDDKFFVDTTEPYKGKKRIESR